MSSVIRFGSERPTRCAAFVLIINDATVPNKQPIKIDPQQSGIDDWKIELNETADRAIATPVTAAESSKRTTFRLGSAVVLT